MVQFTARKGSIKVSHKWMGFTDRQDLKLSAGLDVSWPTKADEPASVSCSLFFMKCRFVFPMPLLKKAGAPSIRRGEVR